MPSADPIRRRRRRRRRFRVVDSLALVLLLGIVGAAGAGSQVASARSSAGFTGQVTWVRNNGVKVGKTYLHAAGKPGWDDIKRKEYALRPGQQIRVMRGLVQFKVQLGQSSAKCVTFQSQGFLAVNPRPQVLLDFRGGTSQCSTVGIDRCFKAVSANVNFGNSNPRRCSSSSSTRTPSSSSVTAKPTSALIEVIVRPKSVVVKVRRGLATVSGVAGQKKAVVVSSNGRNAPQQVVVPKNGNPQRPARAQLTPQDSQAFAQLAAELPAVRDFHPPLRPRLLHSPPNPSKGRQATFTFASPEPGTVLSCALNRPSGMNDDFRLCAGSIMYADLTEGFHTFKIRATDAAGNTSPIRSYRWRVDLTPPEVFIDGPPSPTVSQDATFTFTADEPATFTCALDQAGPKPCSSPMTYSGLDPGRHTFTVEPTDRAGNSGPPDSYSWTIERLPPAPIAFESDRDGNYEIYLINPDGTGEKRLTNNPDEDVDPDWSPDGKRLAFESTRDTHKESEIYVMNADGSAQTRVTMNPAIDRDPKWSPFGDQIAFETNRDGNYEIYVIRPDSSGETRLTTNLARDADPAWSPDGKRIAVQSSRDGNDEIYVMDADGSQQTRLTTNPAGDSNPDWSPDGSRIAFESDRDGNHEIYVMAADGSSPTRLTTNIARDSDPAWSPDGSRIAFASERDGNLEIYVMNADGSDQHRLTNNPGRDLVPNW